MFRRGALFTLLWSLTSCAAQDISPAASADVTFAVSDGAVTGPDSMAPGWTRLRVEEHGGNHRVVIFRIAESITDANLTTFLAVLDTANFTPPPTLALGGSEIGDSGDIVLQLTPGRYILACVVRDGDGHRHLSIGEAKTLVVTNAQVSAARDRPPVATQEVKMVDFAFVGPERWPAGSHMLRVPNEGRQDHVLILARLRPGSSLQDWMKAPDDIATPVAGVARIGPGAVAYLPVELQAGAYVAYCLVTDPSTKRQHIELGMLRAIFVE